MKPFKKPYQQKLFIAFVAGEGSTTASRTAGVSEPTARKFRADHLQDIRDAQQKSTDGVLEQLKDLLPDAAARLRMWLHPPPPPPPAPCDCGLGPVVEGFTQMHVPTCASLKKVDVFAHHAADIRTIRTIFDSYEVMRVVDQEKRIKALEQRMEEAAKKAEGK